MILTSDQLVAIVPAIKPGAVATFLPWLQKLLPVYGIDTPQRVAGFLAQVAEESINFAYVLERSSGAEYEGNLRLGNTVPGDGVKYKGRGLIQITGKSNYKACSLFIFKDDTLLTTPDLLTTPQYAVLSAVWYWQDRNLNAICDEPENWVRSGPHQYTKIQYLTLEINGGQNGIDIRTANYQRARTVLNF